MEEWKSGDVEMWREKEQKIDLAKLFCADD